MKDLTNEQLCKLAQAGDKQAVRFPGSFCRPVEPLALSIVMLN